MQPQKYLTVFNLGIQNTFVYRWNYLLRAIFGIIPLVGTVFLWRAIFRESGGGMRGYDYGATRQAEPLSTTLRAVDGTLYVVQRKSPKKHKARFSYETRTDRALKYRTQLSGAS